MKRKTKRYCECGAEITIPRVKRCAGCKAKAERLANPATRIVVGKDGRAERIDLTAKRPRKRAKPKFGLPVDPRAARSIAMSYAEGEVRKRAERRHEAEQHEREELDRVRKPVKAAAKKTRERERTGHASTTPEQRAKAGQNLVAADKAERKKAPFEQLLDRNLIEREDYEAGLEYYDDFVGSGFNPSCVPDLTRQPSGQSPKDPAWVTSEAKERKWKRFCSADAVFDPFPSIRATMRAVIFAEPGQSWSELAMSITKKSRNVATAVVLKDVQHGCAALRNHYAPAPQPRMKAWRSEAFTVNDDLHDRTGSAAAARKPS